MKEELQIKVKVDTSSVTTTLNKLKNEVSNVEKAMDGTASSSTSITTNTNKSAQAQTKLTQKVSQMVDKMKSMKGMGFIEMAASIGVASKALEGYNKLVEKTMKKVSESDFVNDKAKMAQGLLSRAQGLGLAAPEQGSNQLTSGTGFVSKDFNKTWAMLGSAKNGKQLGVVSAKMKELGVNIEALGLSGNTAAAGVNATSSAMIAAGAAATAAAAAVAVFVAALAAIAIGVATALKVSKLGDEIYHNAQRFNMSSEAFQEWSWIMERNGGTIDDLTGFMETLASEQAAVIEGSEDAAKTFERLGLSMEEVSGMRQQQLFEETVKRIQQIGDETERSAIAYSLFGDEASKFMNVLNMTNEEMTEVINNYHLLGGAMSGELVEKSNKLQNSVAGLKEAWKGISNTIAELFIPIAQKIIDWLTKALVVVNLFLKSIFGLDLKAATGDAMDGAASSTDKYASSTKAATKAAEELKRVTMGFDELNIVSDPNKGSASSSGGSTPGMGSMGDIGSLMPNMSDLNLEGIYAWFEKYKGIIAQITTWSLLLIGILLTVIGCMTMNIPMAAIGIGMAGLGITIGIKSGAFAEAWEAVKKIAIAAGEWIAGIPGWFWESVCVPIGNFFVDIGHAIADTAKTAWNNIKEAASSAWTNIKETAKAAWDNVINTVISAWNNTVSAVKTGWNAVTGTLSKIGSWIYDNVIAPVGKFFSNMWNGFKNGAKQAWEDIKSFFKSIPDWFSNIFTKAWNGVKAIFSTGGKIFDGIKDGIASAFKTVVNGLIGGINKVISVPFNKINEMLNKIRDVNILGVEPFKSFWKHNPLAVPQIPKLAKGGIATASTIANIGEAGKEAILPLENNTEWMDTLATKIAERNSAPSKIVLQVGEKELGWATINGINNITKQTGNIQLVL